MTLSSKAGLSLLISMLLFAVLTALVFAGVLEFRFEYTDPVNGILLGALFCTVYLTVFLLLNIRGGSRPLLPEESPEPYGPIAAAPQAKGPLGSRMEPAVPPKAADPSQGFLFYRPFS
ncbi:MAG: hypothetical protein LBT11_02570, partial [Treponema sp.]|nr:hypothetical protein [Treponema sp.]